MPGRLEFDLGFGRAGRPRDESKPMRLLLATCFAGRRFPTQAIEQTCLLIPMHLSFPMKQSRSTAFASR